jgi:hypothetical protein
VAVVDLFLSRKYLASSVVTRSEADVFGGTGLKSVADQNTENTKHTHHPSIIIIIVDQLPKQTQTYKSWLMTFIS